MTDTPKKENREQKFKRLFPWMDPKYAASSWADPEEYDAMTLSEDLQSVKNRMVEEYVTPYNLPWLPGYVLKLLVEASKIEGAERAVLTEKAWDKLRMSHLGDVSRGRIRIKDETAEPMPDEVKEHLRKLNEQRREENRAKKERFAAFEPVKKSKIPVFADSEKQKEVKAKYGWVVAETFRQDPEKAGGTIVDIKCQSTGCAATRTVHLADCFQVKFCLPCKGRNGKQQKLGEQQPSR